MADYNNVRINGTPAQQQALRNTFNNVQKYCSPDAAKQIPNVDFIFAALPTNEQGEVTEKGNRQLLKISTTEGKNKFTNLPLQDQLGLLCHELSHIERKKNGKNPYFTPSKEDETEARMAENDSMRKMEDDQRPLSEKVKKFFGFNVPSSSKKYPTRKEIMVDVNNISGYDCLPEKEPKTAEDLAKAGAFYGACKRAEAQAQAKYKLFVL